MNISEILGGVSFMQSGEKKNPTFLPGSVTTSSPKPRSTPTVRSAQPIGVRYSTVLSGT